jgi:AcrR family transcriptional regulator
MEKTRNASLWTEVGYELFAMEGLDGIQVERLARILQHNKSGFYHYFGDMEVFCDELLRLHLKITDQYLIEVKGLTSIDPEFLQLLVKYKTPVLFQLQLIRSKDNRSFHQVAEKVDQREEILLRDLWSDYIGFHDNPTLAIKYYGIVRDMLYTRISPQNMNYTFLHNSMTEAKLLMDQIVRQETNHQSH